MPFYRFSAASTAVDDGYSVIAPNVGTGRWLLLRSDTGVNSIVALRSIPIAERSPNLSLYVVAENKWYTFDAAAPSAPTDVAPNVGTGRWVPVDTVVEVIPPYQRVIPIREAIEWAEKIEFDLIQPVQFDYREALAYADQLTFAVDLSIPIRDTLAYADRVTFAVDPVIPYRDAIGHAENIQFSLIAAGNTPWIDLATADWLNTSTTDWLEKETGTPSGNAPWSELTTAGWLETTTPDWLEKAI